MLALQDHIVHRLNTPQASGWLAYAGLIETFGFNIRADLLVADKVLLSPDEAWRYAAAAAMGSVVAGGALYVLGALLAFTGVLAGLSNSGLGTAVLMIQQGMHGYAPLLLLAAGVATLPFGFLMLLAGLLGAAPLWLLPAALVARGFRFGLMAWLLWRGGTRYRDWLARYYHGLTMVVALGLLLVVVLGLLMNYL